MPEQSKKRVLVTGANGLLGANIVEQLTKSEDYTPVAMVRKGCDMRSLDGLEYELFEGNITDIADLEQAISGCNFVIHSAAMTAIKGTDFEAFERVNITPTKNIARICAKHGVRRMVFVSTANCFTNGSLAKPGNELGGFMPWLKKSGYAYSKLLAQEHIQEQAWANELNAIVVAPTFMLGSRDAGPSSGTMLLYGLKKRVVFYPPGGKSFVDVRAVAKATVTGLTKGESGELFLLSGENMTYRDFFRTISKVSGKRKLLVPVPGAVFGFVSAVSELVGRMSGKKALFDKTNKRLLCLDNYFSNNKAVASLDMEQTDVESSVEEGMRWFGQNGYL
ncbi:putative oxidoreductase [Fulvitalea axinellae]|uniref:Oxidoreductase n=1 Tax=Fulvitalea axinellae TaxID=1182444 RepID=A0AAU9CXY2_9BACT|nr:putative oxidoreductase [Fulvitalea axinellae]